ncbi:hypothetical protein GCM10009555_057020 [Acrocarpospora macrocephala]|uniref:Uncharacterized protein n=1 Tax=Acrocarpospora macrocephala TaxID=150177 RepID=A0A5M3WK71_9ACTN|nr:hypothetical protein [Acrocarpospora macrocephala]GES08412.1 hypothetical protein Amac_020080 [Acrocarpospora macrocephala]
MTRTIARMGDRLLSAFLPKTEAQADLCYESSPSGGCNHYKQCYPNPTGNICLAYARATCGSWTYLGRC